MHCLARLTNLLFVIPTYESPHYIRALFDKTNVIRTLELGNCKSRAINYGLCVSYPHRTAMNEGLKGSEILVRALDT